MLRDFLKQMEISKRALTTIKYDGGSIKVNGIERTVRWMVEPGDSVTIEFPSEVLGDGLTPEYGKIAIIKEDDSLLIVEKPAGQGTIPSRNQPNGTLANFVAGKFVNDNHAATVHVVTRLDTDTSGIVCIAKNRHIHHLLSRQMQQTGIRRRYVAFVSGWMFVDTQTIEQPIGRKDGSIIERIVRADGQYARTEVTVIERVELNGEKFTVVELQLHTGRTHQIRVHMAHIHHPLLGDDLYGGPCELISRQALHCTSIAFHHPATHEYLSFESDLADDLQALLSASQSLQEVGNSVNFSG